MSTQQPYPSSEQQAPVQPPAKKKKRVFMWFFLAVQLIFVLWLIAGGSTVGDNASECTKQVSEFFTQQDCEAARGVGSAIGMGMIFVLWLIVDFILVLIWAVVKLARR